MDNLASGETLPAVAPPQAAPDLTYTSLMSGGGDNTQYTLEREIRGEYSRSVLDRLGGRRARVEARERLVEVMSGDGRWCLLTVTVDRERFASPAEAYAVCAPKLADLMRALLGDSAVWSRVLEFQSASGEGFPHWHLVFRLPHAVTVVSLRKRLWQVWRDSWHLARGGLDLVQVQSRIGAARYLGKYFFKGCTVPPWVLERERAPRMFGCSRAASLIAPAWRKRRARREGWRRALRRPVERKSLRTTVGERLARGGSTCCVVDVVRDSSRKRVGQRFVASGLRCSLRDALTVATLKNWAGVSGRESAFSLAHPISLVELRREFEEFGGERVEACRLENLGHLELAWEFRAGRVDSSG